MFTDIRVKAVVDFEVMVIGIRVLKHIVRAAFEIMAKLRESEVGIRD